MSNFKFSDMVKEAQDAGAIQAVLPDGPYTFRVVGASAGATQKGDPRFGFQFRVVGGPHDGKTIWENVNFIASSPQGIAISFRFFASLGIDAEFFAADPSPEQVKERILQIPEFSAEIKTTEKNGYTNIRFSRIQMGDGAGTAPASASGVPQFTPPASAAGAPSF